MSASSQNTTFIVCGMHLSENLLHHKISDVRRILEDKGFEEDSGAKEQDGTCCYRLPGNGDNGQRTRIWFDDAGFVEEQGGVEYYEEAV